MRLVVTTPTTVILDRQDVSYVRAEDESGSFGVFPGHADFMTVLTVSVITWRNDTDRDHFIAVRGGVLTVQDGNTVEVQVKYRMVCLQQNGAWKCRQYTITPMMPLPGSLDEIHGEH